MKKAFEMFSKVFLSCFGIIILWIIATGILEYNKVIFTFNPLLLILGIIIYILLVVFFYNKCLKKLEKIKGIEYVGFAAFTILAICSGLYFKLNPTWDMGTTYGIAKEYVECGTYSNTFYLSQFPNNVMMTSIDMVLLKISSLFGINDSLTVITIVSALVVSLSIILSFYTMKRIYTRRKALAFLCIALFTTPLYLYAAEYYTDVFSMIIPVILLNIWLSVRNCEINFIKRFGLDILFSIILFIGIDLKLTSAFIFVAIIFYEVLQVNIKNLLKNIAIIIPITAILIVIFNLTVVKQLAKPEERLINEVPKEHWIMMGMNGVGNFSYEEYAYTNSYKTFDEKKEADKRKIIERLKERDLNTHIKNITRKLGFAWHDGTYWAPDVLRRSPVETRFLHKFVLESGEYNVYYKYIPQTMHFAMLIFIIFNIIRIIKEKDYESKDIITLTTMFGVMLFLILWENRSRYLVNILPLMIMSQINGIDEFSKYLKSSIKECKFNSKKELLPSDCERKAE